MKLPCCILFGLLTALAGPSIRANEIKDALESMPTPAYYMLVDGENLPFFPHIMPLKSSEPSEVRKNGEQGTVELGTVVTVEGKVTGTFVVKANVSKPAQRAVGLAVRQWRFPILTMESKPVRYVTIVNMDLKP